MPTQICSHYYSLIVNFDRDPALFKVFKPFCMTAIFNPQPWDVLSPYLLSVGVCASAVEKRDDPFRMAKTFPCDMKPPRPLLSCQKSFRDLYLTAPHLWHNGSPINPYVLRPIRTFSKADHLQPHKSVPDPPHQNLPNSLHNPHSRPC